MFLRNNVFPRDAVNPKGKIYPIFGRGAVCAVEKIFGNVPVNVMCPVSLAPAVCMQRSRLAEFLKLTVFTVGGVFALGLSRKLIALSRRGILGGLTLKATKQGWLWLKRRGVWFSESSVNMAIGNRLTLCPVLTLSSRMVCREPVRLFVG